MDIGEKIKKLRREKNWSQDFLGEKIGVHGRHVSRWENNRHKPSVKIAKRLAEVFGVSVDELTTDNEKEKRPETLIQDSDLFRQFLEIQRLNEEDKTAVKRVLQAMITNKQLQSILVPQQ